jgi:hypothetical protein
MGASGANWWWDATSNPVGGCFYVTPGCTNCFVPAWIASHTHPGAGDIHRDVIKRVNERWVFNGKLTALPDGHPSWTWALHWKGAEHPKLGPGKPSLIWIADLSDPFADHPNEIISVDEAHTADGRSFHVIGPAHRAAMATADMAWLQRREPGMF